MEYFHPMSNSKQLEAFFYSVVCILLSILVSVYTQFITFTISISSEWMYYLLRTLVYPGILEEVTWRVWAQPSPFEDMPITQRVLWCSVAIVGFILYHPMIAYITKKYTCFYNPGFLALVLLLGITCTVIYQSSGSILPCILLHWIMVAVWLCILGGDKILFDKR